MKTFVLSVLCVLSNSLASDFSSVEVAYVQEQCCSHGQTQALNASSADECVGQSLPEDVDQGLAESCGAAVVACCQEHFQKKDECILGMKLAANKECFAPKTDIGKTCCEECSFGRWAGESSGARGCAAADSEDASPTLTLRSFAYKECCLEAAKEQEATTTEKEEKTTTEAATTTEKKIETTTPKKIDTTTEKKIETTTEKKVESTTEKKKEKHTCKSDSCEHICNDESGEITCLCHVGYQLQKDNKTCIDINECKNDENNACTNENEVCHNTPGSFRCVPLKKREAAFNCPPGFKKNVLNQVCDDINECQLPRPPCPKYLCENTIGGYKCGGKPGKPVEETPAGTPVAPPLPEDPAARPKNDICPPGFRAGPDDECIDVDECDEHTDDCQRLSQYCINTNGGFFCQDHVSKRCAPGFKVNIATGICEDIDECDETPEVCKRSQICVNLAGAYDCKSKISTLPKLATKTCQEGTRLRPGGTVCEDIDECREGNHLCDQFQNCVNTYGGHECRCKNGFELDPSSSSCVDIDECALKLDNCAPGQHCLNVLGTYTCSRRPPSTTPAPTPRPTTPRPATPRPTTTTTTTARQAPTTTEEYYYYDSDEVKSATEPDFDATSDDEIPAVTTPKPTPIPTDPPRRPTYPNYYPSRPRSTTTRRTPSRPERPYYVRPTTTSTTTEPPREVATVPEESPEREYPTYPTRPEDNNVQPDDRSPERPYQPPTPRPGPLGPRYPRPEYPEDNSVNPYNGDARPEYRPRPAEPTRPNGPYYPTAYEPPRVYPTEVTVDKPTEDAVVVEKDKDKEGSYGVNTSDIPKNQWTSVVGRDKPEKTDIDIDNIHCLNGYERDAYGNCVDIDECQANRYLCSNLENCVNTEGGYSCECVAGYIRVDGWCKAVIPPLRPSTTPRTTPRPTTPRTTTPRTTTPRPTTPRPTTPRSTTSTSTTTERTTTETEVATTPRWRYTPPNRPRRPYVPPRTSCELGYTFDPSFGRCVDIDECARDDSICAPKEDCVNQEGGYYCVCGARCRSTTERPPPPVYEPQPPVPPVDSYHPTGAEGSNVITVGAQYGQRGPRYLRPSFSRLPNSGAIVTSCPWGYKLTPDKMCYDIDECAKNVSQCGPQQRCENFYGGYSCQCPAGHKLYGKDGCEDIDECAYGSPCAYNAKCVNTVGSYRCECGEGFRNSPSNDKVCVDVDECAETPQVCHQSCSNAWGSYRCYCQRGYRLKADNRTCEDVDECAEWGAPRLRGRLCGGACVNEPGSYRCTCPPGYRLSDDLKSCIDIDECETGEATCASSRDPGYVCQNTRGSYHCHHIECPPGYRLEAKHRCTRIQRSCPISDWSCLQRPSAYSYNFITFVANIFLPSGSVDLFTMHGPSWRDSVVSFELRMIDVQANAGVTPADLRCFDMRPADNVCVISLLCSLGGPQVAELELTMSLYQRGQFAGNAVARLIIIVSQYDF